MATEVTTAVYRNFIGGEWRESGAEKTVPNRNPANLDEVLGTVRPSSRQDVVDAIQAAAAAFPGWRQTPAPKRGRILLQAARLFEERKEELARLLTREEGKPLADSRGEIQRSINIIEFFAGEGRRVGGETLASEFERKFACTIRQPLGVVAVITPWNFPVAIPVWKIAPALVYGNSVVFKPATLTPECAVNVVELFREAGVPDGVLNLVIGAGSVAGEELLSNPLVRGISFTGSTEIGTRVNAEASGRGCRVQCEMGGKNPAIVLDDADLDLAVGGIVDGAFGSTGQRCTATSRVIATPGIADRLVERLVERARVVPVGDGLDEGVMVGPLVDQSQLERVLSYVDIGRQEGARLLVGGEQLKDGAFSRGYFVGATVFDQVTPSMRVASEEIFGPVLSVIRAPDFDSALEAANAVPFGLTASLYTNDASKIFRFVDGIETGICHVNAPTLGGEAHMPFGGIKSSGVGPREQGRAAMDFYTELKSVYIDYTGQLRSAKFM